MSIELNKDNLEKTLASDSVAKEEAPSMSKEEEIGVHKGSLNTLAAERMELLKMLQNVEAIMQAHLKRLEELGVKIEQGKE